MQTTTCLTSLLRRCLAVAALSFACLHGSTAWSHSSGVASPLATVGLTWGQTARINVINTQDRRSADLAGPVTVELSFHGSDGNPILDRSGLPLEKTVTLEPGQGDYLDLPGWLVAPRGSRVGIIPCIKVLEGSAGALAIPSLELYGNRSGITTVLSPGIARGFDPQPDPPAGVDAFDLGLAAITDDLTARLAVLNSGNPASSDLHEAVVVEVLFHDAAGNILVDRAGAPYSTVLTLVPNQAGYLDLNGSEISTAGERVGIVPCVKILRGTSATLVVPTLEVFRNANLQTQLLANFPEGLASVSAPAGQ